MIKLKLFDPHALMYSLTYVERSIELYFERNPEEMINDGKFDIELIYSEIEKLSYEEADFFEVDADLVDDWVEMIFEEFDDNIYDILEKIAKEIIEENEEYEKNPMSYNGLSFRDFI